MKGTHYGRWHPLEEEYMYWIILCFERGLLEDIDGRGSGCQITLRQYIATRLNCDVMRVTKRLKQGRPLTFRGVLAKNFNRRYFVPRSPNHRSVEDETCLHKLEVAKIALWLYRLDLAAETPLDLYVFVSYHAYIDRL
jgi:hypothetical protein